MSDSFCFFPANIATFSLDCSSIDKVYFINVQKYFSRGARKPVFRVSDQVLIDNISIKVASQCTYKMMPKPRYDTMTGFVLINNIDIKRFKFKKSFIIFISG